MAVALAVSAALAYQAFDAARSHREVARTAVSDLAAAAAWQLSERGQLRFFELVRESLADPVQRARSEGGAVPSLDHLAGQAWNECRCVAIERPATFFALPFMGEGPPPVAGELATSGATLREPVGAWLVDRIAAAASELSRSPDTTERHPPTGLLLYEADTPTRAFVYYLEGAGSIEAAYGYEVDGGVLLAALLNPLLASASLLPGSLTGGLPTDSLFRVEVRNGAGSVLFASDGPSARGRTIAGSDHFPAWAGGMEVRVTVPEERAETLVIGGLPASRLPMILLLLGFTGGILLLAVLLLRQQSRLARMRSDFVTGVTHELRTPLAQIRMFAELLSLEKLPSPEERKRAVDVIDEESRRLDHLIDNVLGFARMGAPASPVMRRPLMLDRLLPEVVERFRPLARERKAAIELEVEPGLCALADDDAVHRILLNLLDNAVKYGPRGQRVRVRADRDGGSARIEVCDEGPGVPAAERGRIWEPYERLESGPDRGVAGNGIGLAVVKSLVDGHGGSVAVADAPHGGACFVVRLPLATAPSAGSSPTSAPPVAQEH
jgi:signal transduction histidine kinase